MPRSKEFEPNDALSKAMWLFWHKGYLDTSMDELVRETGVSRYGFYSTFGDKRDLFLKTIDYYSNTMINGLLGPMETPEASVAQIQGYFNTLLSMSQTPQGQLGCLIANTAVELAQADDAIAGKIDRHYVRMRAAFQNALLNAVQRGELSTNIDVAAYADYLIGVANGFVVCVRAKMSHEAIVHFLGVALTALSS